MTYTIEEEITARLVSQGIVGAENASIIRQVKAENPTLAPVWNYAREDSAMKILWRLVESILKEKA